MSRKASKEVLQIACANMSAYLFCHEVFHAQGAELSRQRWQYNFAGRRFFCTARQGASMMHVWMGRVRLSYYSIVLTILFTPLFL
jgi:hypothetical protein